MTVESFDAARVLARRALRFPVEAWGTEDDMAFRVYPSPQPAALVPGTAVPLVAAAPWEDTDAPAYLVDKVTGVVSEHQVLGDLRRFTSMTPVGVGHPADLFA